MENELFLAPGKNASPPVAAEVLFLFPQQQLTTSRASDQVHSRQQQQQRASLSSPQDPATIQICLGKKERKDEKTNKQRKGIFAAMVIFPSGRNQQQREKAVSVKRGVCKREPAACNHTACWISI